MLIGASQDYLQREYHINATPTTYLLDENGRVLFHEDGYQPGDEKKIEAKIEAVLNGTPAAPTYEAAAPCPVLPGYVQMSTQAPSIFEGRLR